MSFKNLGNKQTIVLHNCEIDKKKNDLVITPHTQTVGYIRTKRQTQPSQNMKIYPQNPTDIQNPQQTHIQNPFNTQSFQPITTKPNVNAFLSTNSNAK